MYWASTNLPQDYFYSTADDDFMINVGLLKENIDENIGRMDLEGWKEFPILCGFVYGEKELPVREENRKWYLPVSIYKWKSFPQYCHGGLYTISVKITAQLYEESRLLQPLSLDDVWITGILRNRLGMPDDMVIKISPPPGIHFDGYVGKDTDSKRVFMQKDWNNIFDKFKNTMAICTC